MRNFVISLISEMVVWYGTALLFLYIYISYYAGQPSSISHHLYLLTSIILCFITVRLIFWKWFGGLRWLSSGLGVAILILILLYYALVLVGLQSWGRIITWNIISTYFMQLIPFLKSQGISPLLATLALALLFLFIAATIAIKPAKNDWVKHISNTLSRTSSIVVALSVLGIAAILFSPLIFMPWLGVDAGEPLSMTFYPNAQATKKMQGHRLTSVPAIDLYEENTRRNYIPNSDASTHNVIVIVADALRPDHMQIYGYPRKTTPYLSGLYEDGQIEIIDKMWGVCAQSSCGLLAIARSKYVHQLSNRSFNLLDVLKLHGYTTKLILGGDHTNFYGLREAYGKVDTYFDATFVKGYYMNDDALVIDHVNELENWNQQPTYMQFHLMSTHYLGIRQPSSQVFQPSTTYAIPAAQKLIMAGPDDEMTNYYDNGIYQLDNTIKKLIDLLSLKGYLDKALVIITSDHGEMLGEHGRFGHSKGLYENVLRLPFLLLRFGYSTNLALQQSVLASQVDIAPTILADLNMTIPSSWSGQALQLPVKRDYIYFQQAPFVGLIDASVTDKTLKYWRNTVSEDECSFNILTDPGEHSNIINRISDEIKTAWHLQLLGSSMIRATSVVH